MCHEHCQVKHAEDSSCRGMSKGKRRCGKHPLAFITASFLLLHPRPWIQSVDAFSNRRLPTVTHVRTAAKSHATVSTFRCADEAYRKTSVLYATFGWDGGGDGNNGRRGGGGSGGGGGDSGGNNRDDENNSEEDGNDDDNHSSAFPPLDNSKRQGNAIRLFGGGLLSLILQRGESALPQTALQLASSAAESSSRRSLLAVTLAHHNQLSTMAKNHLQSAVASLARSSSWYMMQLETRPLITKCVTGGLIGFLGDIGAQCFAHRLEEGNDGGRDGRDGSDGSASGSMAMADFPNHSQSMAYDLRRGLSVLTFSMFFSGPILHYSYDLFERLLPVSKMPKGFRTLTSSVHVMADALILDSIFVASNMFVTGLLEGYRLREDVLPQFQTDFAGTLKTSWGMSAVIAPYQLCCFRFLPASLRVLAVNLSDVAWDGVVSYNNHLARGTMMSDGAVESIQ
mmetsp:Transcript_27788/g.80235  ORF Transcript_27788/g.80235 Transcript_27788/m.80235 type:complete len:454 (+) Transcript_27788:160-1521(+)